MKEVERSSVPGLSTHFPSIVVATLSKVSQQTWLPVQPHKHAPDAQLGLWTR